MDYSLFVWYGGSVNRLTEAEKRYFQDDQNDDSTKYGHLRKSAN